VDLLPASFSILQILQVELRNVLEEVRMAETRRKGKPSAQQSSVSPNYRSKSTGQSLICAFFIVSSMQSGLLSKGTSPSASKDPCVHLSRIGNSCQRLTFRALPDTEEAPFQCTTCGKCFRRQDVLRRHSKDQCDRRATQLHSSSKQRTAKACNSCRSQKLKCNGTVPCQRCALKSIVCLYTESASVLVETNVLSGPGYSSSLNADGSLNDVAGNPLSRSSLDRVSGLLPISPVSLDSTLGIRDDNRSTLSASTQRPTSGLEDVATGDPSLGNSQLLSCLVIHIAHFAAEFIPRADSNLFYPTTSSLNPEFFEIWPDLDQVLSHLRSLPIQF
jgi:hypothetical protein